MQELAKGYNFSVFFDQTAIPFSRISGIEQRISETAQEEGGRNNTGYVTESQEKTLKNLRLERGIPVDHSKMKEITTDTVIEKEISVYLKDDSAKVYKAYYFQGCVIKAVALSQLDAKSSEIVMQTVEISYQTVEVEDL